MTNFILVRTFTFTIERAIYNDSMVWNDENMKDNYAKSIKNVKARCVKRIRHKIQNNERF